MRIKYFVKIISLMMIIYFIPVWSQAALEPDRIEISNGKISVNVNNAPLKKVLTKISEQAGVYIYVYGDSEERYLTANFTERPFESGLRSILKGVNYAIVYRNNHRSGNVHWIKNCDKKGVAITSTGRKYSAESSINSNSHIDIIPPSSNCN